MGVNSFDKLIEPYKEGGTELGPVDVTIGNICSKLMVQYRIPADVVGTALYKVMDSIANKGLIFEGNGKYGSKGAELFSCIKAQCVDITEKKSTQDAVNVIMSQTACFRNCKYRKQTIEKISKWRKIKNYWAEPRESNLYCIVLAVLISILLELAWRFITA